MHRKTLGEEPPALGRDLNFVARLKLEKGALDEAGQLLLQTLVLYQKTLPSAHPYMAMTKIDLGHLYLHRNRSAEAEAPLRDALRIQQTLYGMMQGKTVIAIAHRLSTIAQMDRILVMDQGRIVEEGTHSGLLEQGGLYAPFWARQSGGFLNPDPDTETEAAEGAAD